MLTPTYMVYYRLLTVGIEVAFVKKGGRLKDRISFYTVGLTMMIFDVEVVLTFEKLLTATTWV